MIAKRMRIDLPRRRRGSAGSMSGSCGIILVHPWSTTSSRLVGLVCKRSSHREGHERADGHRRTWRPRVLAPACRRSTLVSSATSCAAAVCWASRSCPATGSSSPPWRAARRPSWSCSPTTAGMSTSLGRGRPVERGIRAMLSADGEDAARIRGGLRAAASTSAWSRRSDCLARSPAGAEAAFTVGDAGYLLVAAPGAPMSPWDHDPPTDLLLFVRRATPSLLADEGVAGPSGRPSP